MKISSRSEGRARAVAAPQGRKKQYLLFDMFDIPLRVVQDPRKHLLHVFRFEWLVRMRKIEVEMLLEESSAFAPARTIPHECEHPFPTGAKLE